MSRLAIIIFLVMAVAAAAWPGQKKKQKGTDEDVTQVLEVSKEPPPAVIAETDRLIFEVTESAVISDLALAQRHVQALQRMGFHVCLDDFGAGAASYGYLQQLSVDVVKIDGGYVRELTRSGRDDVMIRHLVGLCRELKVTTVAEMVETQDVADALRRAGVDYAQGWLFGPPSRQPQGKLAAPARAAVRRLGSVEQWG